MLDRCLSVLEIFVWVDELKTWAPPSRSAAPLPPYAYVPGAGPHPRRSPRGHSFEVSAPSERPWEEVDSGTDERWLTAVDFYNRGFFWESHELWEALWHGQQRRGPEALLLKALIQTAAAHLKILQGAPRGVEILAGRSDRMLSELEALGCQDMAGFDLVSFRVRRNHWFARALAGGHLTAALFPFVHLEEVR